MRYSHSSKERSVICDGKLVSVDSLELTRKYYIQTEDGYRPIIGGTLRVGLDFRGDRDNGFISLETEGYFIRRMQEDQVKNKSKDLGERK